MMFRSLFFIAPLVAADEQTAMLQLNRRGEVSQHSANDAFIGSLEQSLMSKETDEPSKTAMCTYYLKSIHGHSLLQKISELKGQEKTQQLLQRAMDSVGEQNLRNLEENLMNKDDDKKPEVKESEKKLTPCEELIVFRNKFKDHMHNQREVANMVKETGKKVGEMVEEVVRKSVEAGMQVIKDGKSIDEAKKHLKEIKLTEKLDDIKKHQTDEVKKSKEALESAIKDLKGSKMAGTFTTEMKKLTDKVEGYETKTVTVVESTVKAMMTSFTTFVLPVPAPKKDKDGKDVPVVSYTKETAAKTFKDIEDNFVAKKEDEAKKAMEKALDYVKEYINHVFEKEADDLWEPFGEFWSTVLGTHADVKMKGPPEHINDDLFWQQASAYLEKAPNSQKTIIEPACMSDAFDMKKAGEFAPRKICDGADLMCQDEILYLAKKAGSTGKAECEKIEKEDLPNDTKVGDKKITDKFGFLSGADGKTCEKWEKIKDACKGIKKMK